MFHVGRIMEAEDRSVFRVEVLYDGDWKFFEAENYQLVAFRIARDIRESLKLPARVTCAGVVLAERIV